MTDIPSSFNVSSFPTTGAPRLDAPGFSWQQEWYVAASLSDLPRLERALTQGANPTLSDKNGHTAAHWYAFSHNIAQSGLKLTAYQRETLWSWLAHQGVLMHTLNLNNITPIGIMTSNTVMEKCPHVEESTSALWRTLSPQEKRQYLHDLEEGLNWSTTFRHHEILRAHHSIASLNVPQQDDVLFFLGSLLRVGKPHALDNIMFAESLQGLLWEAAYGPEWLYALPHTDPPLCTTLNASLRNIGAFFNALAKKRAGPFMQDKEEWDALTPKLEKRLSLLLQRLFTANFPWEPLTLDAFTAIPVARPFLDAHALHQVLRSPSQEIASPPGAQALPVTTRRPRV